MLRSHTPLRLICTLLLLVSASGESRPHAADGGSPAVDRMDSRKVLLLDAVKKGILSSLGMDTEPRPVQKASQQELRRIYQLYEEAMSKMRGNSSQRAREPGQVMKSTVLFPVQPLKVLQRGGCRRSGKHVRWYRAIFQHEPNILAELTLIRAELKISGHKLDSFTAKRRRDVKVKVNGMKPINSAAWMNSETQTNISSSQDVTLDISAEVKGWMRTAGEPLVVDVGVAVAHRDFLKSPSITVELDITPPLPAGGTRPRRSNKEDNCDERGWCCRRSVTVSFRDIGWTDWVVAPAEYTMHFCDGTCPHNYKPASMHTQVKSQLHQITKGGTPRPCCVPAAYEPMVLLHYDSMDRLKLTRFSDLIVSKCHCA